MAAEQSKRKVWTREETVGFLKCYLARKDEFSHVRKKKHAYEHVLEDMVADGLTDASTTTSSLESRMRTLLGAYKSAKDNARQTGASPCIPPYMNEMEEIFGDSPIISNVHTLQLGHGPVQPLPVVSVSKENEQGVGKVNKKKSYKEDFYKARLELKKQNYEEKRKQRESFMKDISGCFETKMNQKVEIEKQKLNMLEKFLNK